MFKFTKTGVFVFIMFVLFCVTEIFICQYSIESEIDKEIMKKVTGLQPEAQTIEKIERWEIEISKISLNAPILEGTTKEILSQSIGHFENTSKQTGNIGLAAHIRGHEVNYFKDLKLLQQGDEIIYKYNEFEKIYQVEKCRIIRDTEWEYLEATEENMLTLITYVENQPEYRRCIQAVEKDPI